MENPYRAHGAGGAAARLLAAGHAHVATDCWLLVPSVNDEIMPFGFARNRFAHGIVQEIFGVTATDRGPQIG